MHQNPVSSPASAGGTIYSNLQRKIAALDAKGTNLPVVRLPISEKTAQTHRIIKVKLNAQSNYDITQFAQVFDLI